MNARIAKRRSLIGRRSSGSTCSARSIEALASARSTVSAPWIPRQRPHSHPAGSQRSTPRPAAAPRYTGPLVSTMWMRCAHSPRQVSGDGALPGPSSGREPSLSHGARLLPVVGYGTENANARLDVNVHGGGLQPNAAGGSHVTRCRAPHARSAMHGRRHDRAAPAT